MPLGDPHFNVRDKVDMLLSAETFSRVLQNKRRRLDNEVYVRQTKLGWIITDRVHLPLVPRRDQDFFTDANLIKQMEKF